MIYVFLKFRILDLRFSDFKMIRSWYPKVWIQKPRMRPGSPLLACSQSDSPEIASMFIDSAALLKRSQCWWLRNLGKVAKLFWMLPWTQQKKTTWAWECKSAASFDSAILLQNLPCWLCGLRQCRFLIADMINDGLSLHCAKDLAAQTRIWIYPLNVSRYPDIRRRRCALRMQSLPPIWEYARSAVSHTLSVRPHQSASLASLFMIRNLSSLFALLRVLWPRHW